jgi:hypothetical protein
MLFKTTLYASVMLLVLSSSTLANASPLAAVPDSVKYPVTVAQPQTLTVAADVQAPAITTDNFTSTSEAEIAIIVAAEEAAEKARLEAEAAAQAAAKAAEAAANKPTPATAPNFTPNPGSAQSYAQGAVAARGWGAGEFNCLVSLWNKESGWNAAAMNKSSGAYGIPQALPGSKMASAGADWQTNANTQIEWGLGYISGRYGTPCGAWSTSQAKGWY